ncbi:MAG: TIGR02594 family protein [Fluviicola sp.]|nr:TIGR02594 family protein [Fluviicola sp.]
MSNEIKLPAKGYYEKGDNNPDIIKIQTALKSNGYWTDAAFSENFGPTTDSMVRKFQTDNGLGVDGRVGKNTLKLLGLQSAAGSQPIVEEVNTTEPEVNPTVTIDGRAPWMKVVLEEAKNYGGHDESKNPLNARIKSAYFSIKNEAVTPNTDPTKFSWCAAFASWVLQKAGFANPSTCRAREFDPAYDWNGGKEGDRKSGMRKIQTPVFGCIVVWKSNDGGHVGFYYGKTSDNKIVVLGGNQGNSLKFSNRSPNGDYNQTVVGYFLPEDYADNPNDVFTAADMNLDAVKLNKSSLLNKNAETDNSKT